MEVGRCQGKTRDGRPCSAKARPGSSLCPWHDPACAAQRAAWSAKGGASRSNASRARRALPAEPLTADEIRSYLGVVFKGVIAGKIEPGVGSAAATIVRALLDVAKVAEVEQQVAQLRRDMAAFAERRGVS